MEATLKRQFATAGLIERFWENLIKVGKDKMTRNYLNARLELLESYWTKFFETHDELLICDKIESTEYIKADVYSSTEDDYIKIKCRINQYIQSMKPLSSAQGSSEASSVLRQIQLPKLNLPTFDGDHLNWEGFRDLFKSLVHDVEGLAPIQRLQYLKSSLTGEAAAVISSIEMSAEGYALAWEELVTRYDNRRVLLSTHMRALFASAPIVKPSANEINRLLSTVNQASRSFRALGRPVEHWDDWLVHVLVEKLDASSRLLWESSRESCQAFPSYEELKTFLLTRARALEAAQPSTSSPVKFSVKGKRDRREHVSSNSTNTNEGPQCALCKARHFLRTCGKFKAYSVDQRREQVRKSKACFNCLSHGHAATSCPSIHRCRFCREKHHTLLHVDTTQTPSEPTVPESKTPTKPSDRPESSEETAKVAALASSTSSTVLLATAMVKLISNAGHAITARALLDSGSEASFVSERIAQQLRLPRRKVTVTVSGLQGITTGRVTHAVSLMLGSERSPSLRIALPNAYVMPKLTPFTPSKQVRRGEWSHLADIPLADPNFHCPAAIDVVLGADIYGMLLEDGVKRGLPGEPNAHATIFGWVLMGHLEMETNAPSSIITSHHTTVSSDPLIDLQRFWELEEITMEKPLSPEEDYCERLFITTHARDHEGRYTVRLPRKKDLLAELGESRRGALKLLLATENRLKRKPSLRQTYSDFMKSYLDLGHMEPLTETDKGHNVSYYLPHHAVMKGMDPDGKLRVVFNASFRTTTGVSLNDVLLPGPKLQTDLWLILTRWRLHQFAFMTDIVKMFRQIRINRNDADLQRILWRADPAAEVQEFRLVTVTYGTAPAPYLAIRTLLQLADDEEKRFPQGAKVLRFNTYVDDILAGASTLHEALQLRIQTEELLRAGGFPLSKWAGSDHALCPDNDQPDRLITTDSVGALGVLWTPTKDTLSLRVAPTLDLSSEPTKRTILSHVAKLFDPAGWAAPVIVAAKILIQDLWMAGLDWDQPLPSAMRRTWMQIVTSLPELDQLQIPRWTGVRERLELHAFADASERAYAAAIYLRGIGPSGAIKASLLVAKTKVAPTKPISIPRLELCGALLAARLLCYTAKGLQIDKDHLYAWTDAKVVLSWLRAHPSRWTSFVSNRVTAVQELLPARHWHYVHTQDNPADLATRGVSSSELRTSQQWWRGPSWLETKSDSWPNHKHEESNVIEERRSHATNTDHIEHENELLIRFSSFTRLIRISALCLRLLRGVERPSHVHPTVDELERCRLRWLRIAQQQDFAQEIRALTEKSALSRRSSLHSLRPFLDRDGLIRVGGRLEHSPLTFAEKHPIVLAKKNYLSLLLVRDAHSRTLHGGPQLTRSVLSRRYWILQANSLIRSVTSQCIRCIRLRGTTAQQQMGHLPEDRVRASRPFWSAGVDYAGPIRLRTSKGRGHKSYKGYICLFVCMSSRAVHLEAVSDLTSSAFLAAFRRFVARRGHCARLHSDNGTNFRGADRELQDMFHAASEFYKDCRAQLAQDNTEWLFIPPSAPHFGGLWEAGVKATKYHLRRVLGEQLLTYEELSTLLCEIEACLNSRPLYSISNDPSDHTAITPGHLLIGESPISVPEPPDSNESRGQATSRYRLITNIRDHFWRRWSREYLQHLQQLGKWRGRSANLSPGTLVLIKEDLLPPTKWALGRISKVHPGDDGLVRVVTVDTASSQLRRPITKVCPLPIKSTDLDEKKEE